MFQSPKTTQGRASLLSKCDTIHEDSACLYGLNLQHDNLKLDVHVTMFDIIEDSCEGIVLDTPESRKMME